MYSEYEVYKRMYLHLFSAYEDIIDILSESEYYADKIISDAVEKLVKAQNECEDIYLEWGTDNSPEEKTNCQNC